MAHWNEIRDEWRVREMRLCKVPNSEEIVNLYEQRGDDVYWNQFIELMRADAVDRQRAALPGVHDFRGDGR